MEKFGLSSGYFFTGLVLAACFLLVDRDAVLVRVPDQGVNVTYRMGYCQATDYGRLPPPEQVTPPIYPGCEDVADFEDRFFCGMERLDAFIKDQQREPAGSKKESVEVAVTIVRESGKMTDPEVKGKPDPRNAREALRIVQLLIDRDVRWTPGTIHGKPGSIRFRIVVPFHGAGCGS